jgi:hypothetical protein
MAGIAGIMFLVGLFSFVYAVENDSSTAGHIFGMWMLSTALLIISIVATVAQDRLDSRPPPAAESDCFPGTGVHR